MADAVIDLSALDSAASAAADAPTAVETTPVTESTTPEESTAVEETTTQPTDDAKVADKEKDTAATIDPATIKTSAINAQLQELKKTNEPLAKAIHAHVRTSLQTQAFLKELEVTSLADAKEKLSEHSAQWDSVEATDRLLYEGSPELADNVWEDLQSEGKPEMFAKLGENVIAKLKSVDPAGHARLTRGVLLDTLYESKFPQAVNQLSAALKSNDTATAKQLVGELVRWFSEEQKVDDQRIQQTTLAAEKIKADATRNENIRKEVTTDITSLSNKILGAEFGELLRVQLKSLGRPALEELANDIRAELASELKKDRTYQESWKGNLNKPTILKSHEAKLRAIAKSLVSAVANRKYPTLMKPAPPKPVAVKPAAPPSKQVTIGGKAQTVYQLAKRPSTLIHNDTEMNGRMYTVSDLALLQASKGLGLAPAKSGKGYVWVQWQR
ncbi:MAG: hypothetical protein ABSA33_00450 [Candidatus Micrarchaeaceae archaeon]